MDNSDQHGPFQYAYFRLDTQYLCTQGHEAGMPFSLKYRLSCTNSGLELLQD